MSPRLTKKTQKTFEEIKRVNEHGAECWSSRELSKALGYADYRNFLDVMRKAWDACRNSGHNPYQHFGKITEVIKAGNGAEHKVDTWLIFD